MVNDQLLSLIETTAEDMTENTLLTLIEDALGRVKSNQESNKYVQRQISIALALLDELSDRMQ